MLGKDDPTYDLDVKVCDVLLKRSPEYLGLQSCTRDTTLGQILENIRISRSKRFVILKEGKLEGILSQTDILKFLIE